jgi:hypothetical protein
VRAGGGMGAAFTGYWCIIHLQAMSCNMAPMTDRRWLCITHTDTPPPPPHTHKHKYHRTAGMCACVNFIIARHHYDGKHLPQCWKHGHEQSPWKQHFSQHQPLPPSNLKQTPTVSLKPHNRQQLTCRAPNAAAVEALPVGPSA